MRWSGNRRLWCRRRRLIRLIRFIGFGNDRLSRQRRLNCSRCGRWPSSRRFCRRWFIRRACNRWRWVRNFRFRCWSRRFSNDRNCWRIGNGWRCLGRCWRATRGLRYGWKVRWSRETGNRRLWGRRSRFIRLIGFGNDRLSRQRRLNCTRCGRWPSGRRLCRRWFIRRTSNRWWWVRNCRCRSRSRSLYFNRNNRRPRNCRRCLGRWWWNARGFRYGWKVRWRRR